MKVLRGLAAVITGYLVFAVSAALLFQLSGIDPHAHQSVAFMIVAVVYGMAFAALGGVVTVRIAPVRPSMHATLLTGVIALGASVSLIASPGAGATWSQWAALLLMAPCASLVPWIAGRRRSAGK